MLEVISKQAARLRQAADHLHVLANILAQPESKDYSDVRDRAAYLYLTATCPR